MLSFDLPRRARFSRSSRHGVARSCNVAGLLQGSDPALRHETVVFTAHLDHLGVGEAVDDDAIYNGAFDNASGTSVMIEVARAFRSLPRPPRRSILFLAVTGEEKGLLGSEFFTEQPTVPLDDIVANVNLDMFLMLHPLRDIIAFGEEHSTLTQAVAQAAKRLGFEVTPDPMPSEVIFVRSDQYEFVKKGIPAIFLVAGFKGHQPGKVSGETWMRDIYHTQKDDMNQYMDLESGATFARANLMIGWEIANAEERPRWNAGDFFGDLFGRDTGARAGVR
jgi:Zn-dependent M28 family amino/carboxypeptidase